MFSHFTLKPNAFAKLTVGNFEDAYFLETDNTTEHIGRVIAKYKQNIAYFNTGIEQRKNKVFPLVVWIVLDEKRKMPILNRIKEELNAHWVLFEVVILDEFPEFIQRGRDDARTET